MTIQGAGTREAITVEAPRGARAARLIVEAEEDDLIAISLDANHLRVLAKLAEAAADELDARAVGGVA